MRKRLRLKPERKRVRLLEPIERSDEYIRLRFYWIMELYYIRAKRRNGTATMKDIKKAQRELAKVRKEHG
jgi:hypothetical protein